ncbi:hypothetical protein [Streptomyces sp. NPDC051014]|uniref:hypothetical protein n=1 Tax=Streptomyces sp. NPDC051014 TaxID=3155751 RepID=UPI0034049046
MEQGYEFCTEASEMSGVHPISRTVTAAGEGDVLHEGLPHRHLAANRHPLKLFDMHKNYWEKFSTSMAEFLGDSLVVFDLDEVKRHYEQLIDRGASDEEIAWDAFARWMEEASEIARKTAGPKGLEWDDDGIQESAILEYSNRHHLVAMIGYLAVLMSCDDSSRDEADVDRAVEIIGELIGELVDEMQAAWMPPIPAENSGGYARLERLRHAREVWSPSEPRISPPVQAARKAVRFTD